MTYLEELLGGAAVEWKPLGEVCHYEQPAKYIVASTDYKDSFPTPVLTAGKTFILGYTDEVEGIYPASEHPVIIFDDFTGALRWIDFDFKVKSSAMKMITSEDESVVLLRFIFYWLSHLPSLFVAHDHQRLWLRKYAPLLIPLPPLAVQERIVEILDKFTELIEALETELELRTRQYEYYRNKLMRFGANDPNVQWCRLGDIGTFVRGNGLQKKDFTETGVPCIHYGQIYTYYGMFATETKSFVSEEAALKFKKAQQGDLIIATTSENVRDLCKTVVWLGKEEICVSGETYIFKHNQNSKYLAFYLQTPRFEQFKRIHFTGTTVYRIHRDWLSEFLIPLPPLAVQEQIVEILDKFHTLVHSISEGLPAEIALRRRQYEYYRNLLLRFPRS